MLQTRPATCEECQDEFPPQGGGICGRCGRLLCAWHLHGFGGVLRQFFRRSSTLAEDGPLCVRCRGQDKAPTPPHGTDLSGGLTSTDSLAPLRD